MLAAVGCGAYPDVETIGKKFAKVVDTVEPDPELVAKYEERYQKFRNSVSGDEAIVLIEYLPDILGLLCLFSTTTPF